MGRQKTHTIRSITRKIDAAGSVHRQILAILIRFKPKNGKHEKPLEVDFASENVDSEGDRTVKKVHTKSGLVTC